MTQRDDKVTLEEIRDNIVLAKSFIDGRSAEELAADVMATYAVVRALEIISEATRRLSSELTARHSGLPWRLIADAGNAYRHAYHSLKPELIW